MRAEKTLASDAVQHECTHVSAGSLKFREPVFASRVSSMEIMELCPYHKVGGRITEMTIREIR